MRRLKIFCDSIPFRYGEVFGNHPLFETFGTIDMDTKQLVKITESNLERLKQQRYKVVGEYLSKKDGLFGVFVQIRKPDRFNFLYMVKELLTDEEFSDLLSDIWTQTEFPHMYGVKFLISLFDDSKRELLMSEDELNVYDKLPMMVDVYRGIQDIGSKKKTIRGLSWSLDKEKALWFSKRFSGSGKLYKGIIYKDNIYAYFNGRKEEEIVLNPYHLKNVMEIENVKENNQDKKIYS